MRTVLAVFVLVSAAAVGPASAEPALMQSAQIVSTTLLARRPGFTATITLTGPVRAQDGRSIIRYRVAYDSRDCHAVLDGSAAFHSNTDATGDISIFLTSPPSVLTCPPPAGFSFDAYPVPAENRFPAEGMATYRNPRFGYSLDYPVELLRPETDAPNGDGRYFSALRGNADMAAWGDINFKRQTAAQIENEYQQSCTKGRVTYREVKADFFAFSCVTPSQRVIYQKTLIRGDVLTSMSFEYPWTDRGIWAPVATQVSGSLRAGPGAPDAAGVSRVAQTGNLPPP